MDRGDVTVSQDIEEMGSTTVTVKLKFQVHALIQYSHFQIVKRNTWSEKPSLKPWTGRHFVKINAPSAVIGKLLQ